MLDNIFVSACQGCCDGGGAGRPRGRGWAGLGSRAPCPTSDPTIPKPDKSGEAVWPSNAWAILQTQNKSALRGGETRFLIFSSSRGHLQQRLEKVKNFGYGLLLDWHPL